MKNYTEKLILLALAKILSAMKVTPYSHSEMIEDLEKAARRSESCKEKGGK